MLPLENHIKGFVERNSLKDRKLVVAVSGGPDSVALLHLLNSQGLMIHVAHLNHNLRGIESEEDAEFVRNISRDLGLDFTIETRVVSQLGSLQDQARKTRYEFFHDICKEQETDIVVLAQHKDDQLETILMNFFRGAGLSGLAGIKECTQFEGLTLMRPLLDFTKGEILHYLHKDRKEYRVDSSNKKDKYSRNKFRLNIIPFLEDELGEGFKNVVIANSRIHKLEEDYFIQEAQKALSKVDKTNAYPGYGLVLDTDLGKYHPALIGWVLRLAISRSKLYNLRELTSAHYQILIDSILTNKATTIELPNNIKFARWDNNLGFYTHKHTHMEGNLIVDIDKPLHYLNNVILITEEYLGKPDYSVDLEKAYFPLLLRKRENGDTIKLSPNGGTKKVKDLLIDKKVAKHQRDTIPLLVDSKNNVIAILGYRVSGDYYVKEEKKGRRYYIYINRNGGS